MRGSPLIRALVVFAALLVLAPLLWRITQPAAATQSVESPAAPAVESKSVRMELTFTTAAERVAVLHLGREVWAKEKPGFDEEAALAVPWPKEGIELRLKVQWPEGTRAAMRVKITDPENAEQVQTVWDADEVLTFK